MNFILALAFSVFLFSCKKNNDKKFKDYGCVYGVRISTNIREFIRCGHIDIYNAGNNQTAANTIADNRGIPRENVSNMNLYKNWEFNPNEKCDCK